MTEVAVDETFLKRCPVNLNIYVTIVPSLTRIVLVKRFVFSNGRLY